MKITIHRGTNQIGGCVTEYEYQGWKLFVDYGEPLPGAPVVDEPAEIEGLTCGDISKSALLITHYHNDHVGRIAELPSDLPIYMGLIAKEIQTEFSQHLSGVLDGHRGIVERLPSVSTFAPKEPFVFGAFTIMPVVIDHSAFDAYAFRIEAGGIKVFHTGDFRTHGFRSDKLPKLMETYVGKVDAMVCEATNVNRPDTIQSERELQKNFEEAFRHNKFNVVYASSTNIDRLFGLYHAALRAGRPFYVDSFQKRIMDVVAGRDAIWGKSMLYNYQEGDKPKVLQRDGADFRVTPKFKKYLAKHGYVLIARAGHRFDSFIAQLPDEGKKVYLSQWEGYVDETQASYSPALVKSLGDDYEFLHTSGHCDMQGLDNLAGLLQPKILIPIHTDDPQAFAGRFGGKWPVKLLTDGEPLELAGNFN